MDSNQENARPITTTSATSNTTENEKQVLPQEQLTPIHRSTQTCIEHSLAGIATISHD